MRIQKRARSNKNITQNQINTFLKTQIEKEGKTLTAVITPSEMATVNVEKALLRIRGNF